MNKIINLKLTNLITSHDLVLFVFIIQYLIYYYYYYYYFNIC